MEGKDVPVTEVVDFIATRYGHTMTAKFVSSDKIALYALKPLTCNSLDTSTILKDKEPICVHLLQPHFIFEDPELRGLIAESNSTFVALQALRQVGARQDYLRISRTYRSILRASLERLEESAINAGLKNDKKMKQNYDASIAVFYAIECIWHLFEILYLVPTSTSYTVVHQLLEWVRFQFPNAERNATELLLKGREACESEKYWPTLKDLVYQGQIEVVRALLQLHPSAQNPAFKIMGDVLNTMPLYRVGYPLEKFISQREYWLNESERKLATNLFINEPNLELILRLITGHNETWYEELKMSSVWYELLPGYLFYKYPICKYFELGTISNDWINRWAIHLGKDSVLSRLDYVLLHIMEHDLFNALLEIQKLPDNHWFATHFVDLLYNSGKLSIICEEENIDYLNLRDFLLYEFGSNLMTHKSLWQLGFDYMEQCHQGLAAAELLLTRIPLRNERQAFKILSLARQKGFSQVESDICKILGKRSFDDKRYGNALEWAIRSKDAFYVTTIADFFLKTYTQTGDILCPDVIANIGAKMFISPRLVFLVKYFDFSELYHKRDFLPAAELLVNLLESKITPEYFWPSLLVDTIPLLESKDVKILTKETFSILKHLESELLPLIELKKKTEQNQEANVFILKDYRIENVEEILSLLRLACTRNLSRSLIFEHTEF